MFNLFKRNQSPFLHFSDVIPTVNNTGYLYDAEEGIRRSLLSKDGKLRHPLDDRLTTLNDLLSESVLLSRDQPFFGFRATASDAYQWMTYGEVSERFSNFGSGLGSLCSLGASNEDYLGVYATNCCEWLMSEYACAVFGFVCVPLYDTLGIDALAYIISQTELRVCVCDSVERVRNLLQLVGSSTLKHIIVIHAEDKLEELRAEAQPSIMIHTFEEVVRHGISNPKVHKPSNPSDKLLICYTSGTTGLPKGVIITNEMLIASAVGSLINTNFNVFTSRDIHLSYLSLAHIYEQFSTTLALYVRGRIGFFSGDVTRVQADAHALQPTYFATVPRVLHRIQQMVYAQVRGSKFKTKLLKLAIKFKLRHVDRQIYSHNSIWDRLVFGEVRKKFGGRIRVIISAGAPISASLLQFTRAVFSCPILEGYGSTETSGAIAISIFGDLDGGIVGPPVPHCSIKLCDVPELDLIVSRDNKGEVCCKGPICTPGYFKDDQLTRSLIDEDGWLHTGDVADWTGHHSLRIIDRCKQMFKLAQGLYITPEKIELIFMQSQYVVQVFVDGDPHYFNPVAIVLPNEVNLLESLKSMGFEPSLPNDDASSQEDGQGNLLTRMCSLPEAKKIILDDLKQIGKKSGLKGFEIICNVCLISEPFTVQNGMLTPTMKLVRQNIRRHYQKSIQDLYLN